MALLFSVGIPSISPSQNVTVKQTVGSVESSMSGYFQLW